ncbi:acyltransferase family protein [Humibacter sp.]|uniref:acyltransferase family protein n=1 Tax=Humibacter sp. TaxID=1940291 RepID=UPI003F80A2E4
MRRFPSLDGLRAVAILAVLLGHLTGTRSFPASLSPILNGPYVDLAALGVRVFFVLSGFLITALLLTEYERSDTIRLGRFYQRRALRIVPAYLVFLGVVVALAAWGAIAVPANDLWRALTYTINYDTHRAWPVGHLWSLAVEEQFYLVWPVTLLWAGRRRAVWIAAAVVALVPVIRVLDATTGHLLLIGTSFETTADALATGCLLALCRERWMTHDWYVRAIRSRWLVPALLLAGLAVSLRYRPGLLIGETLVNAAILVALEHVVRWPEGYAGRLLNHPLAVWLGGISYALYLWQQLFLNRTSAATTASFPLNVALAVGCAVVSTYLIERPFRRAPAHGVVTV